MSYFKVARALYSTVHNGVRILRVPQDRENSLLEARTYFKDWGRDLCRIFDVQLHVHGEPIDTDAGLFVGNHASYLDIPLICSVQPLSFVGKAEIRSWPLLGKVGEALGSIWHDRADSKAGRGTAETLKRAIRNEGKRVCVFPEGTTTLRGLPWKPGVFRVAHELNVRLQPFAITYRPAHRAAFEVPSMLKHSLSLNAEGPLEAHLHVGPSILIEEDPIAACEKWNQWNKDILSRALAEQGL